MTLDRHPKEWLRVARVVALWLALPEVQRDSFINALSESEQDKVLAFLITSRNTPKRALKKLENYAKRFGPEDAATLIHKLPKKELEKLARESLDDGKLKDNLFKLSREELRELIVWYSLPKSVLATLAFLNVLDSKRKAFLLT